MASSIMLLVALQYLWLRNSYEKTFLDFSRESSILFRNTVYSLRDSMIVKNIEPINLDSVRGPAFGKDSFNLKFISDDSLKHSSNVQILISSNTKGDSGVNVLKPLASSIHNLDGRRSFVVRMTTDTLNADLLAREYTLALRKADILLPFQIKHTVGRQPVSSMPRITPFEEFIGESDLKQSRPLSDTLTTELVYFNPRHAYAAEFPAMQSSILREILVQILFSVFLTLTVVTSFMVVYRNLRSQQRLNDLKNDFISNVTHELKTPLATVSVALEAMKDFNALSDPERTKEYLNIAQNELHRLTLMTDKVLKASTFEAQGVSFVPAKINLDTIIRKILSSLKLIFEKNELQVTYTPLGNNFDLTGSEVHLTNVIYNLIDNALKYGSDRSSIDLQLKDTGGFLEFTIRDQGIGIAKEYQKKIFEKFFRVPTGDVHDVRGYGLGLSYVARVVEKHRGSIDVESELGKGSLFKIKLPK